LGPAAAIAAAAAISNNSHWIKVCSGMQIFFSYYYGKQFQTPEAKHQFS